MYRIFNLDTKKYLNATELKLLSIASDNAIIEPWLVKNAKNIDFYINDLVQDLESNWIGVLKIVDGRVVIEDSQKTQIEPLTWEDYHVIGNMNEHPERLPEKGSIPTLMELMGKGEEI